MPRVAREVLEQILAANRLEEVAGAYVDLKPDGRNLKGLCPFHQEKTPSFKIHPERQIFRCFGCGQAGDVIAFVQAIEKTDFMGAVKLLAERAGIALQLEEGGGGKSRWEQIRRANELACEFYRRQLKSTALGERARKYLEERGFSEDMQELFRLGVAPEGWEELRAYLSRAGIAEEIMEEAGLVRRRPHSPGWYDYFRGRIMFPILEARGRIIGFGGRSMGEEEPKYLNTPETSLFKKGKVLYGIHLALDVLRATRTAILVEGYTDVIACVAHGIDGVVACLGTALTRDNARELKRYADRVVLVYDGDEAGYRAAERAIGPLLGLGLDVRVVLLPGGQDPCEFLSNHGAEALRGLVEDAPEAVEFLVDRAKRAEGTETAASLQRAVQRCLAPLSDVEDPLVREVVRKKVAESFGVTERAIDRMLPRARSESKEVKKAATISTGPEENLVTALVAEPEIVYEVSMPERFEDEVLGKIALEVASLCEEGFSLAALRARLAGSEAGERLTKILARIEECRGLSELFDWRFVARQSREELERQSFRNESAVVREKLLEAQRRGDHREERKLLSRYQALLRRVKGGKRDVIVRGLEHLEELH